MKCRSCDWEEKIVPRFTREEWRGNFQLSCEMFEYICNGLSPQLLRQDTCIRKAVGAKRRISITLWCLATNTENRTTAHLISVAKSTTCQIVDEGCVAILQQLFGQYITVPSRDRLYSIMHFEVLQMTGIFQSVVVP